VPCLRFLEAPSAPDARGCGSAILDAVSIPSGWTETGDGLEREFTFDSFADAVAFVNRLAELAEAENHHPDIELSFKRVRVRWSTHSAGGVTDRDRELAGRSDELA
jgi:4a-hydroxytetrahydrobiopterin dehydratase